MSSWYSFFEDSLSYINELHYKSSYLSRTHNTFISIKVSIIIYPFVTGFIFIVYKSSKNTLRKSIIKFVKSMLFKHLVMNLHKCKQKKLQHFESFSKRGGDKFY